MAQPIDNDRLAAWHLALADRGLIATEFVWGWSNPMRLAFRLPIGEVRALAYHNLANPHYTIFIDGFCSTVKVSMMQSPYGGWAIGERQPPDILADILSTAHIAKDQDQGDTP